MSTWQDLSLRPRRLWLAKAARVALGLAAVAITAGSAIAVKELRSSITQPMAAVTTAAPAILPTQVRPLNLVDFDDLNEPAADPTSEPATEPATDDDIAAALAHVPPADPSAIPPELAAYAADPNIRWFNGRPARPARTMTMVVTAYSPDWRSCGDSADGITATLHPVTTNGHALVAADPRVLRYGSMLTIPGYDQSRIVPVLDCGGAIKGRRLDVLFPTHEQARKWGVQRLRVTIWEYADGKPPENPRRVR